MSKIALKSVVWKEEKAYVALSLNTGVSSFGDTKKEALASLQEALSLYFEDMSTSDIVKIGSIDVVPMTFDYV
ncbi:hypothetical protein CO045_01000 [Candidatus Peregrinibacteria bacterium CG_4_9_14_0_2_um_filter_41_14]|nr:MAG: hypothetical protein COY06_03330 [Candidatus Peregrinibacteria bacterium CG_4_10_14_0_2_um_filter_41_8]PJC38300.1 MAG: hypothetical protein CO045_01000 [Candidatus Peregrinibacteria bacterium CG_4_9_14_0_2_um_filter_41_14]